MNSSRLPLQIDEIDEVDDFLLPLNLTQPIDLFHQ
jgi:hypothetical protein